MYSSRTVWFSSLKISIDGKIFIKCFYDILSLNKILYKAYFVEKHWFSFFGSHFYQHFFVWRWKTKNSITSCDIKNIRNLYVSIFALRRNFSPIFFYPITWWDISIAHVFEDVGAVWWPSSVYWLSFYLVNFAKIAITWGTVFFFWVLDL